MNPVEGNPFTVQVGPSVLARAATLDDAILTVLGHFEIQRASEIRLGGSLATWAATIAPRSIRHAGRTLARVTPRPDGSASVVRFDHATTRLGDRRCQATQRDARRPPVPSIVASSTTPTL